MHRLPAIDLSLSLLVSFLPSMCSGLNPLNNIDRQQVHTRSVSWKLCSFSSTNLKPTSPQCTYGAATVYRYMNLAVLSHLMEPLYLVVVCFTGI